MLNHEEGFTAGPSGFDTAQWVNKRYSKCPIIIESFRLKPGKTSNHHPQATCKYCEKQIICGAKERLIAHLKHCKKTTETVRSIVLDINFMKDRSNQNNNSGRKSKNSRPIKNINNNDNQNNKKVINLSPLTPQAQRKKASSKQTQKTHIDKLYLKLVISKALPLNLCDAPEFRQLIKLMSEDYEPPTSATFITKVMRREASQLRRQMIEILSNLPKRSINLEFDSWSDRSGRILYVFVINVEINGKVKRYLYSLREESQCATEEKVIHLVADCVGRLGSAKLNSLTSDNDIIFDPMTNSGIRHTNPHLIVHHCLAFFSSELFMDLVKHNKYITDMIGESYRLLSFISSRQAIAKKLEVLDLLGQVGNQNRVSWSSLCDLLTVLTMNSSTICTTVESYLPQSREKEQFEAVKQRLISNEFWQGVDDAQNILSRILQLAGSVESNVCRLSDFFALFLDYGRFLLARKDQRFHIATIMSFLNRFCQLDISLIMAAYLLDPRYNGAYVREEGIKLAIERILTIASEQGDFDEDDGKVLYEYWELFLKRQEPFNVGQKSDPIEWWMSIRSCPQSIQAIATRILRLRTSPANARRILSLLRWCETEQDAGLDPSTLEDLAILRYAYEYEVDPASSHKETNINSTIVEKASNGEASHSAPLDVQQGNPRPAPKSALTSCDVGLDHLDLNTTNSPVIQRNFANPNIINLDEMEVAKMEVTSNEDLVCLDEMVEYRTFLSYIDFDYEGVRLPKVCVQKKKWTAQDVLSKLEPVYT